MKIGRHLAGLLAVLWPLLLLVSCTQKAEGEMYTLPDTLDSVKSGTIAANGRFSLEWDDTAMCVMLREEATDYVWATTPYDYYLSGGSNYNLCSPLTIEYYNRNDGSRNTASAVDCMDMGTVSTEKTPDGIRVCWYFDEAQLKVPVVYTLRQDSLLIAIDTAGIEEGSVNCLLDVSVAPYLCAVKNDDRRSDYLFVPAGSGALMYTDTEPGDAPRAFFGEVYGSDPARRQLDLSAREEPIRLPVFGAKTSDHALCAIIEKGDGAATLHASAGNPRNGYSTVYVTFNIRGYNNAELETTSTIILSPERQDDAEFAVGFYPLYGEEADYTGMAACYRRYLQKTDGLRQSTQTQAAYQMTFIGGAEVDTFTLGVPHTTLLPLTTFADVQGILNDLNAAGVSPSVVLRGFGQSGVNVGKLAGGYAFSGALDRKEGQQALESYCRAQRLDLFTDFDLVYFSRSGSGLHPLTDGALAANRQIAALYPRRRNVFTEDTEEAKILLLGRTKLDGAAEKLLDFCRERVSGISLSTLGQTAYSDYRDDRFALRGTLAEQMRPLLDTLREGGHAVSLSAANGYIAGLADSLGNVPLQNGSYDAFDECIPFYEMIYHGTVPMYSTAVNLSDDPQRLLLRAAEAGVAPAFQIAKTYDAAIATTYANLYSGIVWEDVRSSVTDTAASMAGLVARVAGAEIRSHAIVQAGVTRTVFSNGVIVTVDHTEATVRAEGGSLSALSFTVSG